MNRASIILRGEGITLLLAPSLSRSNLPIKNLASTAISTQHIFATASPPACATFARYHHTHSYVPSPSSSNTSSLTPLRPPVYSTTALCLFSYLYCGRSVLQRQKLNHCRGGFLLPGVVPALPFSHHGRDWSNQDSSSTHPQRKKSEYYS